MIFLMESYILILHFNPTMLNRGLKKWNSNVMKMWVGCVACRRAGWLTGRARHPGIRAGSQPDQQPGIWASPSQPQPGEPAPPARPARRPSGQPVPDPSPKNALAVNAKGLPMHTSLTRPVHPPVAPVVGRSHNRRLFHHLNPHPPVVALLNNRRMGI